MLPKKMVEVDRKIEQLRKQGQAVVDSLLRALRSPIGKELKRKIQKIANGTNS